MSGSIDPLFDRVTRDPISVVNREVVDSTKGPNATGVVSFCTLSTLSSDTLLRGIVIGLSVEFSEDMVVVESTSFWGGSAKKVEDLGATMVVDVESTLFVVTSGETDDVWAA